MEGKSSPRKPTKERLLEFKGQIKKACDESVREPDVIQNIAITDTLNDNPLLDERADKTLRKLIVHKSPQIAINAINLLQCILQNCDHFLQYVAKEIFMETLKRNIPKKFYLQQVIQMKSHPDLLEAERIDKTLVLFLNLSKLDVPIFKRYYEKLLSKGIKFPEVLEEEQLMIGKPKKSTHTTLFKPKPVNEKKGQSVKPATPSDHKHPPASGPINGPVNVVVTDTECKSYCDNAKVLADLLTESSPQTRLQSDEIIQQLLAVVKQGSKTIGIRIGRDAPEQLMSQLMFTYEELTHAHDYYQGLLEGKAVRSHTKNDRFPRSSKPSTPEPSPRGDRPIPEQDMSKLTEQQQLDLAMKQSLRLQQDEEEKRKKEAADAEIKARKEREEKEKKKETSNGGFDDFFSLMGMEDTKSSPPTSSKPKTQQATSKPQQPATTGGDLFDLSFLDAPNEPITTSSKPTQSKSTPTPAMDIWNQPHQPQQTTVPHDTAGRNPFDDDDDDGEEPGKEGQVEEEDSDEEDGAGPEGFDPFAQIARRGTTPSKPTPTTQHNGGKKTSGETDDPFLALASSRAEDEDSD